MPKLRYRILMVEDLKVAQKVAMLILNNELGCEVDIAETGKQAIECVKQKKYDLIFMDIGLPDMDGLTITKTMRTHYSQQVAHVPIIALTAHGAQDSKERCLEVGMTDFIEKPLSLEDGSRLLEQYIAAKKAS